MPWPAHCGGRHASSSTPASASAGTKPSRIATRTTRPSPTTPSTSSLDGGLVIDALYNGNDARWINHSLRAQLRGRRDRRRPRLHPGAARHRARRGAVLRLRPGAGRAPHGQGQESSSPAMVRRADLPRHACWRPRRGVVEHGDGHLRGAHGSPNAARPTPRRWPTCATAAGRCCLVGPHARAAGRGRLGRAWQSRRCRRFLDLLASRCRCPPRLDLSGLSLAVGCTVADVHWTPTASADPPEVAQRPLGWTAPSSAASSSRPCCLQIARVASAASSSASASTSQPLPPAGRPQCLCQRPCGPADAC